MAKISGDWSRWGNVQEAIQGFVDMHGRFPKYDELKSSFSGLSNAISRHYGGLRGVAARMGYEVERKEDHYYKDPDNIMSEIRRVMEERGLDSIPSYNQLRECGESGLARAIALNGGVRKFREAMGENKIIAKPGVWKNPEYALRRAREALQDLGVDMLPSQNVLKDSGYWDLVRAIQRFHGGFHEFRKLLGESPQRAKSGTWRDLDRCVRTVVEIIQEDGLDEVPSSNYLGVRGYNGLAHAISKYHGGFPAFRELLQQRMGVQTEQSRLENLLDDYVDGDGD